MILVRRGLLVISVCAVFSCQSEDSRLREEAARLVSLYAQVKYDDPPELRETKLSAIEQAVFVSDEVVGTRTICVEGHRTLIGAQRAQAKTAKDIDRAIGQVEGAAPLPEDVLERLQKDLTDAQTQLGQVRKQLEACEGQIRALNLRFGHR